MALRHSKLTIYDAFDISGAGRAEHPVRHTIEQVHVIVVAALTAGDGTVDVQVDGSTILTALIPVTSEIQVFKGRSLGEILLDGVGIMRLGSHLDIVIGGTTNAATSVTVRNQIVNDEI